MLNRKDHKVANGSNHHHTNGHERRDAAKARPGRRRFIISPKAAGQLSHATRPTRGRPPKVESGVEGKAVNASVPAGTGVPGQVDLTETIKTLLHLAHEHGHITYDDINDILPEGLSPEDLDELYTKLRNLDVEIVDHAEV